MGPKRKFRRNEEVRPKIKRTKWNKRRAPLKKPEESRMRLDSGSDEEEAAANTDKFDSDLVLSADEDDLPAVHLLTATFAHTQSDEFGDGQSTLLQGAARTTETLAKASSTKKLAKMVIDGSSMNVVDKEEIGQEDIDSEELSSTTDPDVIHFETLLSEEDADRAKRKSSMNESEISLPMLGSLTVKSPLEVGDLTDLENTTRPLEKSYVRQSLVKNISNTASQPWTPISGELFSIMNTYRDLYHFEKDYRLDGDMIRAYCLHILNHILKSRSRVVAHNAKLLRDTSETAEFKDQGFTRPKVLVIVPFKQHAYRIYQVLSELLASKDTIQIMNKGRFETEFGWQEKDPVTAADRPEDFRATFTGNTDDCFRVGISLTKKSLKLYTEFYSSDLIIASPLGLRMIIGTEGEKQHEYDFLSSIEILILDQADIFMMQNWEHISWIMKYIHLQPRTTGKVDFSRVRSWVLNGWGQLYRQTIFLSAFRCPEFQAFTTRSCTNFAGSVCVKPSIADHTLSSVVVSAPHCFHRLPGNDFQKMSDARFKYFTEKILPQLSDSTKAQTMIFIPSYFDFVRIRNHFKREDVSFVQICEYTSTSKVARARDLFYHGKKQLLLYTERFHFYRRYRIKGIRHILFYDLPHYSHFYPELCNMMLGGEETAFHQFTSDVLYSKFDSFKLAPVVGQAKVAGMLQSDKPVHLFVTSPAETQ